MLGQGGNEDCRVGMMRAEGVAHPFDLHR